MNIVMEAWRELCLLTQPGSIEGMHALTEIIAEGPSVYPCEETIKEMKAAKLDSDAYSSSYSQDIDAFDAVINGVDNCWLSDRGKLRSRYPWFIKWCAEVFPG